MSDNYKVSYNVPVPSTRKTNQDYTALYVMLDDFIKSKNKNMCFTIEDEQERKRLRWTIDWLVKKHDLPIKAMVRGRIIFILRKEPEA